MEGNEYFIRENKEILDAELWALGAAKRETRGNFKAPITVFTDSREVLTTIQQIYPRISSPFLRDLIYQRTLDLKNIGRLVTIRWIPGHVGLIGHDKADQSAKDKARRGGNPVERWSSLTHIQKKMVESRLSELAKWHETKKGEREASRRGFYFPRLKAGMDELLGSTPIKYASRYFQLKTGHGATGTFLVRIGVIEPPACWWCGEAEQSVEHLYTKCRGWRRQRRKLIKSLSAKNINWQGWAEEKGLAKLVADERALGPLLEFLKATEVGSRAGAKERELEWERRNDHAGEDLLSN